MHHKTDSKELATVSVIDNQSYFDGHGSQVDAWSIAPQPLARPKRRQAWCNKTNFSLLSLFLSSAGTVIISIAAAIWTTSNGLDTFSDSGPPTCALTLIGLCPSLLISLSRYTLFKCRPGKRPKSYGWGQTLNAWLLYCDLSIATTLIILGCIEMELGMISQSNGGPNGLLPVGQTYEPCPESLRLFASKDRCEGMFHTVAWLQVFGAVCIFALA